MGGCVWLSSSFLTKYVQIQVHVDIDIHAIWVIWTWSDVGWVRLKEWAYERKLLGSNMVILIERNLSSWRKQSYPAGRHQNPLPKTTWLTHGSSMGWKSSLSGRKSIQHHILSGGQRSWSFRRGSNVTVGRVYIFSTVSWFRPNRKKKKIICIF